MEFLIDFVSDNIVEVLIAALAYLSGQQGIIGRLAAKVGETLKNGEKK